MKVIHCSEECRQTLWGSTGVIRHVDISLTLEEARANANSSAFVNKIEEFLNGEQNKKGFSVQTIHINEQKKIVVVVFSDGTKEIVKCSPEDSFDPEIGFALALSRKLIGSKTQVRKMIASQAKVIKKEEKPVAKKRGRPSKKATEERK